MKINLEYEKIRLLRLKESFKWADAYQKLSYQYATHTPISQCDYVRDPRVWGQSN